jgi:hypothetical protein
MLYVAAVAAACPLQSLQPHQLHSCQHSEQLLASAELSFPQQRSDTQLAVLQLPTEQQSMHQLRLQQSLTLATVLLLPAVLLLLDVLLLLAVLLILLAVLLHAVELLHCQKTCPSLLLPALQLQTPISQQHAQLKQLGCG